jgi:hypothetical protein
MIREAAGSPGHSYVLKPWTGTGVPGAVGLPDPPSGSVLFRYRTQARRHMTAAEIEAG